MKASAVAVRIVVWFVVLALGAEVLARLFLTSPSIQQFDPQLGYTNAPNARHFQSREGFQALKLNELGLNDKPIGEKKPGQRRILFIGDSLTFAAQVPATDNITGWVEKLDGVDAVNAGREGLGPESWTTLVDRLDPKVQPDEVAILMTGGDAFDLRDAKAEILHDASGAPIGIKTRASAKDALQAKLDPFMQRSALVTYLARRATTVWTGEQSGNSWFARLVLRRGKPATAKRNSQGDVIDPQASVRQIADIMIMLQQRRPTTFISVPTFKYGLTGKTEYVARSKAEVEVFREAAKLAGVRFVEVGPELARAYAETGTPLSGFQDSKLGEGHLNRFGNEVVGRAVARALATPPPPSTPPPPASTTAAPTTSASATLTVEGAR